MMDTLLEDSCERNRMKEYITHENKKYIFLDSPMDSCRTEDDTPCAFIMDNKACSKHGDFSNDYGGCKRKIFVEAPVTPVESEARQFWGGHEQVLGLPVPPVIPPAPAPEVGRKFDADKPMYDLIPPFSLEEIAKNLTYGAKKYAPDNWRNVANSKRRYFAAAMRHLWKWWRGQRNDPENDIHHLAAACVNIMFLMEVELEK